MGERLEAVFACAVNTLDARTLGCRMVFTNTAFMENFEHYAPRCCQEFCYRIVFRNNLLSESTSSS
jgi:hypothetical protein